MTVATRGAVYLLLFLCCSKSYAANVNEIYQWSNLEYDYSSEADRQAAINQGKFVPGNPRFTDVDVYYNASNTRTVFVTCPRYVSGVPATLGTVTNKVYNGERVIAPYPSWEWHTNWESCPQNRMVSVFRIKVDELERLWVIDSGLLFFSQKCPAQILAFDLKTNTLIHRYEIPNSQLQSNSMLNNPIVDIRDTVTGNGTFLYLTDTRGFAIIVYDVDNKKSWKVTDKTFQATPDFGTFCVPGAKFDLMDGVQGAALSPYKKGQDRVFYYHALASNSEQWVWTSILRNSTLFSTTSSPNPALFNIFCGRRDTQASVMAIDQRGIAYFGLGYHTSLNCWNTTYPYGKRSIRELYRNSNIQYITGMKIAIDRNGREELWFLNTRIKRIVTGPTNDNITNFRIHSAKLSDFSAKCSKGSFYNYPPAEKNYCQDCVNSVFK